MILAKNTSAIFTFPLHIFQGGGFAAEGSNQGIKTK